MAEARRLKDGSLGEGAWRAQVEGLARFYSWLVYHSPDNKPNARGHVQRVTRGFPDLVLVRGPELLFVELKAERGRVSAEQAQWIAALELVAKAVTDWTAHQDDVPFTVAWDDQRPAVETHVWRPSDWDQVQRRLARGRALAPMPAPT